MLTKPTVLTKAAQVPGTVLYLDTSADMQIQTIGVSALAYKKIISVCLSFLHWLVVLTKFREKPAFWHALQIVFMQKLAHVSLFAKSS